MSEKTKCNYCDYMQILADAKRCGQRVTLLDEDFGMGGQAAYMHPKKTRIESLSPGQRKKFFRAWFMKLTDYCVCYEN